MARYPRGDVQELLGDSRGAPGDARYDPGGARGSAALRWSPKYGDDPLREHKKKRCGNVSAAVTASDEGGQVTWEEWREIEWEGLSYLHVKTLGGHWREYVTK